MNYKEYLTGKKHVDQFNVGEKFTIPYGIVEDEIELVVLHIYDNVFGDTIYLDIMSTLPLLISAWKKEWRSSGLIDGNRILRWETSGIKANLQRIKSYFNDDFKKYLKSDIRTTRLSSFDFENGISNIYYADQIQKGTVWLPTLTEVIGENDYSNANPNDVQLDYFKSRLNRIITNEKGNPEPYWLCSTDISGTRAVAIDSNGCFMYADPTAIYNSPFCLTLKVEV